MTTITLPHPGPSGFSLEIDFDYSPGTPSRTWGPPEDCYEGDPEEFTINEVFLIDKGIKTDVTSLITSELCEGVIEVLESEIMKYVEAANEASQEPPDRSDDRDEAAEYGGRLYP